LPKTVRSYFRTVAERDFVELSRIRQDSNSLEFALERAALAV